MDFVHDQLATGRKIRVLTVVDTFSRYAPVIDPRFSYRGEDVVQVLEKASIRNPGIVLQLGLRISDKIVPPDEGAAGVAPAVGLAFVRTQGARLI